MPIPNGAAGLNELIVSVTNFFASFSYVFILLCVAWIIWGIYKAYKAGKLHTYFRSVMLLAPVAIIVISAIYLVIYYRTEPFATAEMDFSTATVVMYRSTTDMETLPPVTVEQSEHLKEILTKSECRRDESALTSVSFDNGEDQYVTLPVWFELTLDANGQAEPVRYLIYDGHSVRYTGNSRISFVYLAKNARALYAEVSAVLKP